MIYPEITYKQILDIKYYLAQKEKKKKQKKAKVVAKKIIYNQVQNEVELIKIK